MVEKLTKAIAILFYLLAFLTPLIFFPKSSELFEFNKMVLTYLLTTLIVGTWIVKMIISKNIVFRRTLLDIPLVIFLISATLSTVTSIDSRTSILGYYSRFHGGLVSYLSYTLLYWAYVSNMGRRNTKYAIRVLLGSAVIVCLWGILEHFGHSFSCLIIPTFGTFDVSCWVQDVQNRVFATLGQPNWLAAWIVALIPLTWAYYNNSKLKNKFIWITLSLLFFLALLYTKSRSGILGFIISNSVFWVLLFVSNLKVKFIGYKILISSFLISNFTFLIAALAIGTPWTPNLNKIINSPSIPTDDLQPSISSGPALEVGGTESGKIRQIVWKGAMDIWRNYPILGSGVETFAFAYYKFRPVEHNLTSEWDYLYNKAHNEYLNFAATMGSVGLLSYLLIILASLYQILKNSNPKSNSRILKIGLLAGFTSILVTNFFGFSVVTVAQLSYLFPAMAVSLTSDKRRAKKFENFNIYQIGLIAIALFLTIYALVAISRYWRADYLYAKGKFENDSGNNLAAREFLMEAIRLSPSEAVFWNELSSASSDLAANAIETGDQETGKKFLDSAIFESKRAIALSPANVNIKRDAATMHIKLSSINPDYLTAAREILEEAVKLAPTDAKLFYNLSLSHLRSGDYKSAIKVMEKTISLKPNYQDARFALALMYVDAGEKEKAKEELGYILKYINPNDPRAKRELEEIGP